MYGSGCSGSQGERGAVLVVVEGKVRGVEVRGVQGCYRQRDRVSRTDHLVTSPLGLSEETSKAQVDTDPT